MGNQIMTIRSYFSTQSIRRPIKHVLMTLLLPSIFSVVRQAVYNYLITTPENNF